MEECRGKCPKLLQGQLPSPVGGCVGSAHTCAGTRLLWGMVCSGVVNLGLPPQEPTFLRISCLNPFLCHPICFRICQVLQLPLHIQWGDYFTGLNLTTTESKLHWQILVVYAGRLVRNKLKWAWRALSILQKCLLFHVVSITSRALKAISVQHKVSSGKRVRSSYFGLPPYLGKPTCIKSEYCLLISSCYL